MHTRATTPLGDDFERNEINMAETAHSKALFSVLTAGTLWSFGALTIRHMVDPQIYRWQYLFFRGLTVAAILCIYLIAKDGGQFFNNFKRIGMPGVVGAFGLLGAFICFIWSITLTIAANTLFLFATTPFLAAFMGIVILKEKIRPLTWIAMTIALIGIAVMVIEGLEAGSVLGTITGFAAACGFQLSQYASGGERKHPSLQQLHLRVSLCDFDCQHTLRAERLGADAESQYLSQHGARHADRCGINVVFDRRKIFPGS